MKSVYEKVKVEMTPSAAMMKIHKVLNEMPYPNVWPLVETCEKIAFALGFECNPTKTEKGRNK